ncbi:hypothetical protein NPIL_78291 [Nephila pilipes]|uniref:Uncharacterized protein n=1 Tax=Nephila pilipes TaxID=299642 RepID=A0A8X6Q7K1_NEPPI|nr:hypothetical protein NPIL_78291 [Nephila pilipes]
MSPYERENISHGKLIGNSKAKNQPCLNQMNLEPSCAKFTTDNAILSIYAAGVLGGLHPLSVPITRSSYGSGFGFLRRDFQSHRLR